jgi:DNA-binding winged helix-turn-helix (wHTH) protein
MSPARVLPASPIRIGPFELDLRSRELRKGSTRVQLQGQPFEILCALLERPGDVVTRDELRDRLWPDGTFVDFEHSLNAAIKRLRTALGDQASRPTFVETVPRCGYRYIAEGRATPSPSRHRVILPFRRVSRGIPSGHTGHGLTPDAIVQLADSVARAIVKELAPK